MLAWIVQVTWNVTLQRCNMPKDNFLIHHVKDTNHDPHVRMFKATIRSNGEMKHEYIINLSIFTLRDIISKWNQNYLIERSHYISAKLE
jgi:hypothetical protein